MSRTKVTAIRPPTQESRTAAMWREAEIGRLRAELLLEEALPILRDLVARAEACLERARTSKLEVA